MSLQKCCPHGKSRNESWYNLDNLEYRMNPRNNSHVARLARNSSDRSENVFNVHPLDLRTFAVRILRAWQDEENQRKRFSSYSSLHSHSTLTSFSMKVKEREATVKFIDPMPKKLDWKERYSVGGWDGEKEKKIALHKLNKHFRFYNWFLP